jgi:hypothetical protein
MKGKSIIKEGNTNLVIDSTEGFVSIAITEGNVYNQEPIILSTKQMYQLIVEMIEHKNNSLSVNELED